MRISYVPVNLADTGDIVAAATGKTYRLLALFVISASAVNMTLRSGTTARSGAMPAAQGITLPFTSSQEGWAETATGEALNVLLSSAVQLSGLAVVGIIE